MDAIAYQFLKLQIEIESNKKYLEMWGYQNDKRLENVQGFLNKNSLEKNFIEVVDSPCTVSFTGKPAVQKHLKLSKHILSDAGKFCRKDLNGDHNYDYYDVFRAHDNCVSC